MLIIAYILVYWNESSTIITSGAMVGSFLGVISSLIYLRMTYNKSSYRYKSNSYSLQDLKKDGKKILQVSIPIAIGALSMPLLNLVDSLTVPHVLQGSSAEIQSQFGIYSRGSAFTQLIVVFASAIVFPLIPLLTSALAKKRYEFSKNDSPKYELTYACANSPVNNMVNCISGSVKCGIVYRCERKQYVSCYDW